MIARIWQKKKKKELIQNFKKEEKNYEKIVEMTGHPTEQILSIEVLELRMKTLRNQNIIGGPNNKQYFEMSHPPTEKTHKKKFRSKNKKQLRTQQRIEENNKRQSYESINHPSFVPTIMPSGLPSFGPIAPPTASPHSTPVLSNYKNHLTRKKKVVENCKDDESFNILFGRNKIALSCPIIDEYSIAYKSFYCNKRVFLSLSEKVQILELCPVACYICQTPLPLDGSSNTPTLSPIEKISSKESQKQYKKELRQQLRKNQKNNS
uniref:Uncharacterized protein n=1 Tax=Corethron hystrix TaxID=216773 RepID=A0A7S1FU43_9STRA|mmetsp:Transcript_2935/g.5510  ORF Transcript_2935/g.5510 Transcript_2935/m.5510 type:complete len:264 (+) Transcript_2935:238-1029(+)